MVRRSGDAVIFDSGHDTNSVRMDIRLNVLKIQVKTDIAVKFTVKIISRIPLLRAPYLFGGFQITAESRDAAGTKNRRENSVLDRKSTRLNSSHSQISYAVFFFKKK